MAAPDLELKKAFSELQTKMIETKQVDNNTIGFTISQQSCHLK
jgi:hypothetical protein